MTIILATALLLVGAVSGMLAYGALSNLWADYKDSATSTYLEVGLPALAVCIAALVGAALLVRRAG